MPPSSPRKASFACAWSPCPKKFMISVTRHRHRHPARQAGTHLRGVHAGRCQHHAQVWRHRPGPGDHAQVRRDAQGPHLGRIASGRRLDLHLYAAARTGRAGTSRVAAHRSGSARRRQEADHVHRRRSRRDYAVQALSGETGLSSHRRDRSHQGGGRSQARCCRMPSRWM